MRLPLSKLLRLPPLQFPILHFLQKDHQAQGDFALDTAACSRAPLYLYALTNNINLADITRIHPTTTNLNLSLIHLQNHMPRCIDLSFSR